MKCFRCDRCGEFFKQTDTDNFIAIGNESLDKGDIETGREYHLCSRCIDTLDEWINNHPNKELDWIWEYIDDCLSKNTYLRIGQFLSNMFTWIEMKYNTKIFYEKDDKLREYIVEYCKEIS